MSSHHANSNQVLIKGRSEPHRAHCNRSLNTAALCFFRREQGSTLVSLAIALPLVLVGIFGIIYFSIFINTKTTLDVAVPNGVAFGARRGDQQRLNYYIPGTPIRPLQPCSETGIFGEWSCYLQAGNFQEGAVNSDIAQTYQDYLSTPNLGNVPPQYWISLAYIYAYLQESLGSAVRFPCSNQDHCVSCRALNPQTQPPQLPLGNINYAQVGESLGFQCTYCMKPMFLARLVNLAAGNFGMVEEDGCLFPITSTAFVGMQQFDQ
jgi:hypothetical protein